MGFQDFQLLFIVQKLQERMNISGAIGSKNGTFRNGSVPRKSSKTILTLHAKIFILEVLSCGGWINCITRWKEVECRFELLIDSAHPKRYWGQFWNLTCDYFSCELHGVVLLESGVKDYFELGFGFAKPKAWWGNFWNLFYLLIYNHWFY